MPISREQEIQFRRDRVLELSSKGLTQQEIAVQLKYTQQTISNDLKYLQKKAIESFEYCNNDCIMPNNNSWSSTIELDGRK